MQSYLISLVTLSISLFAVSALIVRPHRTQAHIFLSLVLLANAISYVWLVARGVGMPIVPLYRLDAAGIPVGLSHAAGAVVLRQGPDNRGPGDLAARVSLACSAVGLCSGDGRYS